MFLLGRGRVRVRPPAISAPLAAPLLGGVRHRGSQRKIEPKPKGPKPGAIARDAQGRPIVPAREKSLGIFKALSATNLTHELFESNAEEGPGRVALDVPGMQARMMGPGVVTRFEVEGEAGAPARVYGVPKHMLLEFRILGAPCSVTTSTTLSLIRALEESKDIPARLVLNGRPGCGKSFLLLQAAQYASLQQDWIVLYIPRTRRFVDASTTYTYSLATRTYLQPRAARETLSRLRRANAHLLPHLRTTVAHTLEPGKTVKEGSPLPTLVEMGAADEALAPAALDALMRELGEQTRFPVLLAIDDFQTLAGASMYRDPQFRMIRPHHLSMPRLLLEYASGRRKLARGMVLGALTSTDTQFPISTQLAAALHLPEEYASTPRSVRFRRSKQLAAYLEHEVEVQKPEEPTLEKSGESPEPSAVEWTGWHVFDPPVYEDVLAAAATATNRFPTHAEGQEAEWRGMVLNESESASESASSFPSELDFEEGEDAEVKQQPQQQKKKTKANGKETRPKMERALRAIRVPDALSVREAAGLFEMWMDAGVLRTGGERRAARRAELHTLAEYETLKNEVDSAEGSADPNAASSPFPVSSPFFDNTPIPASAVPESDLNTAHALRDGQRRLASAEYADIRGVEGAFGAERWARERAVEGARVRSFDEEKERELRAAAMAEEGAEMEAEAEAMETDAEEDDALAAAAEASDALEDAPPPPSSSSAAPSAADAGGDPTAANGDAVADAQDDAFDPSNLFQNTDPEIAQMLSEGIRGALANPSALGSLMRTGASTGAPPVTEAESGADELFLAKYTESSGNARAFVWGGVLGTLQTSG